MDIGWLAIPLLFVAVIGTVNGTNFTDGLDGLASSVTVLVATFFTVVAVGTKSGVEPITCAVVGALLGFLLYNVYPASVFMGCLLYTSKREAKSVKKTWMLLRNAWNL